MEVQNAIGERNFKIVVSKSCKKSALYISEGINFLDSGFKIA